MRKTNNPLFSKVMAMSFRNLVLRHRTIVFAALTAATIFVPFAQAEVTDNFYKKALPGYKFSFPRDHASHEDFKTEWWYYTGHLKSEDGNKYGYELTFFRSGVSPSEKSQSKDKDHSNVYLAHFAVSDINNKKFHFFEKLTRSGLSLGAASKSVLHIYNDGWRVDEAGDAMMLSADAEKTGIKLLLTSKKPPVIHGKDGVSQKADCIGCASHYYSLTRMETKGLLFIDGKEKRVTGTSWMDHEFGSNQLTEEQIGWDWFSLQLNDNTELMLYMMRKKDGSLDKNSSGTLILADGKAEHLSLSQFKIRSKSKWLSPKSKGNYPMNWDIEIPSKQIKLQVNADFDSQELVTKRSTDVTYWEGSSTITGTKLGKPVTGEGYVEMTGYSETFKKKI
ncbi:MAG TPA: carotenoid 1,2-hydratase [Candidatus Melainabacteria bacterium]|nr:carotenoid 1,2-hydratase [Candidatus Melainabacteria bacterium]HIN65942.1 carotenoid 1,2-hydratase [Candidatus Obscuribacterales bacterium]